MRTMLLLAMVISAPVAVQARESTTALRHQLMVDPDNRVAMVNLARMYMNSGRTAKAQSLYRAVLGMENVALERAGGPPVWSHWLAADALKSAEKLRSARKSARRD